MVESGIKLVEELEQLVETKVEEGKAAAEREDKRRILSELVDCSLARETSLALFRQTKLVQCLLSCITHRQEDVESKSLAMQVLWNLSDAEENKVELFRTPNLVSLLLDTIKTSEVAELKQFA